VRSIGHGNFIYSKESRFRFPAGQCAIAMGKYQAELEWAAAPLTKPTNEGRENEAVN
jgi:hypothetical protein